MRYNQILLGTLSISSIFGVVLFITGCYIRFGQTSIINAVIENVSKAKTETCIHPIVEDLNLCPIKKSFDDVSLGIWADALGSLVIITASTFILLSVCGLVGTLQHSQVLLVLMILLALVSFCLQYYLVDILLDPEASFHDDARDEWRQDITRHYTLDAGKMNKFTLMFNALMISSGCCGASGTEDFSLNYTLIIPSNIETKVEIIKTPPACCDLSIIDDQDRLHAFNEIVTCASDAWAMQSAHKGCYQELFDKLYRNYGSPLLAFLMMQVIWTFFQGLLAFMIILRPPKSPRPSRRDSSSTSQPRSIVLPQPQEPQNYVPFTKISSFVSTDVNRVKSTEIW